MSENSSEAHMNDYHWGAAWPKGGAGRRPIMKLTRRRTLTAAGAAVIAATALTGCHVPADVACEAYNFPGYRLVQAYWATGSDHYVCLSVGPGGSRDRYEVVEIHRPDGRILTYRRD